MVRLIATSIPFDLEGVYIAVSRSSPKEDIDVQKKQ
jgi:hypothetical protein